MILAGIDIGTNTIRLLVTKTSDSSYQELYSGRTITRLGRGLDRTGALAPDAQERTFKALEEFAAIIADHAVDRTAAVGTSALRNAANAAEFITGAKQRAGIVITVISGEEEAKLTLTGVRRALSHGSNAGADPLESALVIDIGGGSTEFIVTRQGGTASIESRPLGAVYLTERFVHHDPPSEDELDDLRKAVMRELDSLDAEHFRPASLTTCAGTAGTITTLAAMDQELKEYDPDRINGYILSRASIDSMVAKLSVTKLDARRKIAGLEHGREDIILAGAIIAQEIMDRCGTREMLVSDWGLREGIVFDLYEKSRKDKG